MAAVSDLLKEGVFDVRSRKVPYIASLGLFLAMSQLGVAWCAQPLPSLSLKSWLSVLKSRPLLVLGASFLLNSGNSVAQLSRGNGRWPARCRRRGDFLPVSGTRLGQPDQQRGGYATDGKAWVSPNRVHIGDMCFISLSLWTLLAFSLPAFSFCNSSGVWARRLSASAASPAVDYCAGPELIAKLLVGSHRH